ncbi:ABC transporter permease [Nostoc linckia z18]|uniref:ABC transporter permease n=2 Tax=Nostoc linckia TaxID=92942 RepID=A0A9Q5ZAR6_NOSLI|nr:ABC exporter membrane fusion protein [Nostoc linckia]PHK43162.1 ABC transporter permease [Nostoc linckia z15]PHK48432.1 ABC transporter permease [Nostoc linckia z16]PHJ67341.1 ABC transporter permease [Nostoc linckia z1]PHJ71142.1 ABC transporter permease [Nostoc linckia z3]PHJ76581.1 ABC transporter permease [Nostoc linckia z2]
MDVPSKTPQIKRSKRWVLLLAIAVGIATISTTIYIISRYRRLPSTSAPTPSPTVAIARKVTALGRLEPKGEAVHAATTGSLEGTRILRILVKEGDKVRVGQILAILDTRDRRLAALKEATEQVKVAQARLAQVKAGAKAGEINAQKATIVRMEAELQGNVKAQSATVERMEAELRNAETEYKRYQQLYQEGAVSASTLDSKRLAVETAQKKLDEGRVTLKRIQESVQAQLNEAKANLNRIAEVRPTDVQAVQAEVDKAIAAVGQAKADLELSYVRSPRDGRILKIHARPGEVVSNQGEGILKLGQTDQMYAVAEVYETDISKVRLGQRATITSDAFPAKLQGTVDQIGWEVGKKDVLSTDPAAATDVRVVEVKIGLDSASSQRVTGLTNLQVTVEIEP